MEPARLYESPFTDINPLGPEGVFDQNAIESLVAALDSVRRTAAVA